MAEYRSLTHETLRELEAGDYEMLLEFPPPHRMLLDGISSDELYERTKMFFWLWAGLTLEVEKYKEITPCGHSRPYAWSTLILVAGSYYDYLLARLLGASEEGRELPPGFKLADMKWYLQELRNSLRNPFPKFRANACFMFSHFVDIQSSAYFASLLNRVPLNRELTAVFEAHAHSSLCRLHRTTLSCRLKPLKTLGNMLLISATDLLAKSYKSRSDGWQELQRPGLFSMLRCNELPGLAARADRFSSKYGEKGIEGVFEQQLLLLFRSFGFQVVPAPRASRRIDLICVSDGPEDKATVLIEAKTSSHNYSLPASDSRAIHEYVNNTRRALAGLPEVKLVLLVGPKPATTVSSKLDELGRLCQIPCCYISAEVLTFLREAVVGSIPALSFVSLAIEDGPIISLESAERFVASLQEKAKVYTEFIDQMMRLRSLDTTHT